MAIKLIIGLRNPGSAYEYTRHNAGAWLVQKLVQTQNAALKIEKKFHTEIASLEIANHSCKALLPLTFMNHSGVAAREVSRFYRITPEEILVAHDELDLPAGRIKIKSGGGHGGHNGLKDLIHQLESNAFHRLRIGIGHPGHKEFVLNYVLGKPTVQERQLIFDAIDRGVAVIETTLGGNLAAAMNLLNR